jgi:hypothetical protein
LSLYFRCVCGNARCTSRFPSAVFIPISITRKSRPYRGLDRPLGFQKVEAPRFPDNWHVKALRLSVLTLAAFTPMKAFLSVSCMRIYFDFSRRFSPIHLGQ